MKLYYVPGACSLAPHIVATEAGLPLDIVKVDLATHRLEDGTDYRTISKRGYVPLLELDDGRRLTETAVLVQVLADMAPESGLLPPAGSRERVEVQSWLSFVATELHKTFSPWLWHKETHESTRHTAKEMLATRFQELDEVLSDRPYLTGETFTVADAYAFTILGWCQYLNIHLDPYPHLKAFQARVAARPKVLATLRAEGLVA
ncbi:MAG: glutathione transferase GstA [Geminicoccaceae bacterium]